MRQSQQLIENVIQSGGLAAGDLAARAGLSPGNLSRIRSSGKFNADTLERLLAAAGVELAVVPKTRRSTALEGAVIKLNAGRRHHLSAGELKRLLTRFRPSAGAERAFSHLVGVIEELPVELVHDLVIEGSATLPALARIVAYIDGEGDVAAWINRNNT